jgi:hypothetical protein
MKILVGEVVPVNLKNQLKIGFMFKSKEKYLKRAKTLVMSKRGRNDQSGQILNNELVLPAPVAIFKLGARPAPERQILH